MTYGARLSYRLVAEGRFEEALAAAARERAAAPEDPETHFYAGQAQAGLGRLEEAVEAFETALGLDASASDLDPDALDDELFDALRRLALSRRADPAAALATLARYEQHLPAGRHRTDVAKWAAHLRGEEVVWYRDRA